jgi:hypothetical protein
MADLRQVDDRGDAHVDHAERRPENARMDFGRVEGR